MRIIFISKNPLLNETIRNNLSQISEADSIVIFNSYHEARDFINNNIIENQLPLDIIIAEDNINGLRSNDFFHTITSDKARTFSSRDFNFHTLPVILLADKNENINAFTDYDYSDVISDISLDKLNLYIPDFISCVKTWRKQVLDEMDNLGINFNSGMIDYHYYFSRNRKKDIETNILSNNFKLFTRKLEYEWLIINEKQIELAIDKYIKQLKIASRTKKKNEEKKFHNIFNKYPFLLKRDNYIKLWYEPRLPLAVNKYYEPDFALKPNFNQKTDLSVLEIKLPNETFTTNTKFHPKLMSKFMSHLFQVNDYKDYLESGEYTSEIKKVFGFIPNKFEYNLLMGRKDDKIVSNPIINKRMNQINQFYIKLLTYDDIYEYQVKFLKRINLLKIN